MKSEDNKKDSRKESDQRSVVLVDDVLPTTIPIISLQGKPMFPKMMYPIMVGGRNQVQNVAKLIETNSLFIGLLLVKEDSIDRQDGVLGPDDLYDIGVVCKIIQMVPTERTDLIQVILKSIKRFEIIEYLSKKNPLQAHVRYWFDDQQKVDVELKAYSVALINTIRELVHLNPLFKEELSLLMGKSGIEDAGTLADFAATLTTSSPTELQSLLGMRDVRKRAERSLTLLKRELEISQLQVKINKRIEEKMSKQQRDFFLHQQLKEIKKELGLSKDDKDAEIEKYQKRIKLLKLTKEAKSKIDEEFEKLKILELSSPEYTVTRNYLDWLTCLPWGKISKDNFDLKKAKIILDKDHYGLKDVKERILEFISVGKVKGELKGSIILFVGPPGVGKTSIGHSIAESINREFFRFSLGGMRDEAEIKGHRRTYIGAMPGKFIQAIKTCKTSNPIIMLDEVDKIGISYQGDPASALLEVLDPEQNKDFLDHYLDIRYDLSEVLFICTANTMETIPRPLLDRMEVIILPGYIMQEKVQIAVRHLIPRQLKQHGLKEGQVHLSEDLLRAIVEGYAREAGVRGLEKCIRKIFRKCTKKMVEGSLDKIKIQEKDLQEFLGRKSFKEEGLYSEPKVGIVMGLAYTSMGGTTLYIEANKVHTGSSLFKQTGQLGPVMVESSEIAYSYIRSRLSDDQKGKEFFDNHTIHLHVPAGATPKDGPSAGITMASALYSLALDKVICPNLAMTGELSLSGAVMPIGGLQEKVIAAKRAGVSNLIFPKDNAEDFEDLDDSLKEGISPHFVSTFDEVIEICF